MALRQQSTFSAVATNAGAAEAVIASSAAVTYPNAGATAKISGVLDITAGAGTTAVVIKCRQGTTTGGTQVGNSYTHTLAAAALACIPFDFQDTSGQYATDGGTQYSVTVTQTGGTGAGSVTGTLNVEQN